jgi:hypothetical protein
MGSGYSDGTNMFYDPRTLAEETLAKVYNNTGSAIAVLKPVKLSTYNTVKSCPNIELTSSLQDLCVGLTKEIISDDTVGFNSVIIRGEIKNIDTSAWAIGDLLYPTTSGGLTNDPSQFTAIQQPIAFVVYNHATAGIIQVTGMGYKIVISHITAFESLSGVNAASGSNGNGGNVVIIPGLHDGTGVDGKVIIRQPGGTEDVDEITLEHNGTDGIVTANSGNIILSAVKTIVRQKGGTAGTDEIEIYHNGADGFIVPKSGELKTDNKNVNVGTGALKAGNNILSSTSGVIENNANAQTLVLNNVGTSAGIMLQVNGANKMQWYYANGMLMFYSYDVSNDLFVFNQTGSVKFPAAGLAGKIVLGDVNGYLYGVTAASAFNKAFGDTTSDIPAIGTNLAASQVVETDANKKLISAAKGTAFNKNFGDTTSDIPPIGTNLSASQVVETDANKKLITAEKGTAYNKNFGSDAGQVAQGNHNHTGVYSALSTQVLNYQLIVDIRLHNSVLEYKSRTITIETDGEIVFGSISAWSVVPSVED